MYPVNTIKQIASSLKKFGITNLLVQAGIVGVVSTEGGFTPKSESSYRATSNQRLRILFGKRLNKLTDEQLAVVKTDDVKFFDIIYGGKNGNIAVGDGFKYRGRGFNQITFRDLYQKYGTKIGVDLVSFPERLNELQIAADALAAYFSDYFSMAVKVGILKKKFGVNSISEVTDLTLASTIAFQANAGWGTDLNNPALKVEHQRQLANIVELHNILTQPA
jgi:predicted chitinase